MIKIGDLGDLSFKISSIESISNENKPLTSNLERQVTANGAFLQPLSKWSANTVAQYLLTLDRVVNDPIGIESLHSEQLKSCCATIRGENITGIVLTGMSLKELENIGLHHKDWDINFALRLYNHKERLLGHDIALTQDEETTFKLNQLDLASLFSDVAQEYAQQRFKLTMDEQWDNKMLSDWIITLGPKNDESFKEISQNISTLKIADSTDDNKKFSLNGKLFVEMAQRTRKLLNSKINVNTVEFSNDEQRARILHDLMPIMLNDDAVIARREAYMVQILEAVEQHQKDFENSQFKVNVDKHIDESKTNEAKGDESKEDENHEYQVAVFQIKFEVQLCVYSLLFFGIFTLLDCFVCFLFVFVLFCFHAFFMCTVGK